MNDLNPNSRGYYSEGKISRNGLIPVRVLDVILDKDHPEYAKYGKSAAIGAIKWSRVDTKVDVEDIKTLPIAYPINSNIRQLPLKNEIVLLQQAPHHILETKVGSKKDFSETYYTTIVGVWNNSNHNAAPDEGEKLNLGGEFNENSNIKPLQPFSGDIILAGRQGQSIRMSGASSTSNKLTTSENKDQPFTVLVNGQHKEGEEEFIVEDINKDDTSIYLTSNHKVPLEQARDKRLGFKTKPILAKNYTGAQVLINGGRLYFNAKDEDIHFTSKGAFGVSSSHIGLDAVDYIGLDANKIYLGSDALKEEVEPVIKGNELELLLKELLDEIKALGLVFSSSPTGDILAIGLQKRSKTLLKRMERLTSRINPYGPSKLKSKKVFTE